MRACKEWCLHQLQYSLPSSDGEWQMQQQAGAGTTTTRACKEWCLHQLQYSLPSSDGE